MRDRQGTDHKRCRKKAWSFGTCWVMVAGLGISLAVGLTACDLAPDYRPQKFLYPDGWKGKGIMMDAHPADAIPRGAWWVLFNDPQLNALEEQLDHVNPTVQAAAEKFIQARDTAREAESRLYPQVAVGGQASDNKASLGRLFNKRNRTGALVYESNEAYSGAATWEPDFWSRIRNTTRMERALAQATAADYAQARLSLEAELASDYVALRGLDAQNAVYEDSIRYFRTAVEITRLRQEGAIGAGLDVSRADNELYSAMAAQSGLVSRRQILENAIAVLVNAAPARFHIAPLHEETLRFAPVYVTAAVPSTVLQRRPDVAAAERRMAAASRAIGISRAAFYPDISFSAQGGFENAGFDLGGLSNAFWRVAVQAVEPLFTGGLRRAALQRAWSQYRQAVDEYRATVLGAFEDVENGLTQSSQYRLAEQQQAKAVAAALQTQTMTMALYTGGIANYLDALVAQQDALQARLAQVRIQTSHIQASVRLVRALGGGWEATSLPRENEINPFSVLQYRGLRKPKAVGGLDNHESLSQNVLLLLTR